MSLVTLLNDLAEVVGRISYWFFAFGDNRIHNANKFFGVPVSPCFPPLLKAGIAQQVRHCSFDLAPQLVGKDSLLMGEIHCLEILEETIEERAEADLLNRIQFFERLQTAE